MTEFLIRITSIAEPDELLDEEIITETNMYDALYASEFLNTHLDAEDSGTVTITIKALRT